MTLRQEKGARTPAPLEDPECCPICGVNWSLQGYASLKDHEETMHPGVYTRKTGGDRNA